jgi:peptide/nickel transport system permease protein
LKVADTLSFPRVSNASGRTVAARRTLQRIALVLRDPKVACGGGFIGVLVLVALFAPWLAPKNPLDQDIMLGLVPPAGLLGAEHGYWLGTDDLGRDVLSRLIFGTRIALTVAFTASLSAGLIGTLLGLVAGWYGGLADRAISRLIEIWMAFPPVLLSILLVAVIGPGVTSVIFAIVVIDWTRFARVIRAETQAQAKLDYVTSARAIGFPSRHILFQEILPNVMPVVVALLSLEAGIAVIVEAILSFVGLSVSSDAPTWGGMIAAGRPIIHQGWWVIVAPLIVLFLTVLAFNLLGEGLRRALDPVMRR